MTFLASAYGLVDAATVGPIRAQALDVVALLGDPERCQVMLVTLPEETPVNEAADTAFHLEDRAGVQLAPIVVNGVWPHLELPADVPAAAAAAGVALTRDDVKRLGQAAAFRRRRQQLQEDQMARLADGAAVAAAAAAVPVHHRAGTGARWPRWPRRWESRWPRSPSDRR